MAPILSRAAAHDAPVLGVGVPPGLRELLKNGQMAVGPRASEDPPREDRSCAVG